MDLKLCQLAAASFNEEINGAHALINPETRQIAFALFSIAPTCHILREILPYMSQALKTARQLYMEIYWTLLYQKTIKTE